MPLDSLVGSKILTEAITKQAALTTLKYKLVSFVLNDEGYVVIDPTTGIPEYEGEVLELASYGEYDGRQILKSENDVWFSASGSIINGYMDDSELVPHASKEDMLTELNISEFDDTPKLIGDPNGEIPTESTFPDDFAHGYNEYAKTGLVLGALNEGGDKSTLADFLSSDDMNIDTFALALANFWATVAVTPGVPTHGGTAVISVVNDASSKVSLFKDAINASLTDQEMKPYYNHFIKNIEDIAVSQIIWTVTEMMPTTPPAPVPFPESIV